MDFRGRLHRGLVPPLPALDVLDQPTRRLIVALLAHQPATVGQLSQVLELSQPLVSKHVRALIDAGLLDVAPSSHDGRVRLYRLRREPFAELEAWLADIRATWHKRTRHRPHERDDAL
jgi:DNA-binding transcriptional ArsR family regulator